MHQAKLCPRKTLRWAGENFTIEEHSRPGVVQLKLWLAKEEETSYILRRRTEHEDPLEGGGGGQADP